MMPLVVSQLVELFPILPGRRAVQKFVCDFVIRDLFGRGVELEFGVHALRDDAQAIA
jgi:hypothetical protein